VISSKTAASIVSFSFTTMVIGGPAFLLMFFLITAWVTALFVLITMFSGFELILRTRTHRINLALFVFSVALSIVSFMTDELTRIAHLVQGAVYMIGVAERANKHILPIAREMYADFDGGSYAEAFVVLCVMLSFLTIFLPFLGTEIPMYLQTSPAVLGDIWQEVPWHISCGFC